MNIALLGINGKGLDSEETKQAMEKIIELTKMYKDPTLMTMHSPNGGVNTLVELYASTNSTALREYDYGNGLAEWKDSSQMLAEDCDVFFCITTKIKNSKCHHCLDHTHERTGACYSMKLAKKLGKQTKLIIL